jgi:hypothetical protein
MLFFAALAIPFLAVVAFELVLLGFVGWLGHRDNFAGVLVGVILITLSLHVFGAVDVITPIVDNPIGALAVIVGYIVLALPVSQKFLWRNYLIECARDDLENIEPIRAQFYEARREREDEAAGVTAGINAVLRTGSEPDSRSYYEPFTDERDRVYEASQAEYEAAFADFWENAMSPKADENRARILSYMAYWPVLTLYALVGDYLLQMFTRMFETFKRSFDRDSARRYGRSYEKTSHETSTAS